MSFASAPTEPPPPPPLPLNIRRSSDPTPPENPFESAEDRYEVELDVRSSSLPLAGVSVCGGRTVLTAAQSSDEEEELLSGGELRRTHEAAKRALLEEDDDEDDFISEGVKALSIRSPPSTSESKEVAPGEFYGLSEKSKVQSPTQGEAPQVNEEKQEVAGDPVPTGGATSYEELQKTVEEEVKASEEATKQAKQDEEGEEKRAKAEAVEKAVEEKKEQGAGAE